MRFTITRPAHSVRLTLCIAIFLLSCFAWLVFPGIYRRETAWPGYHTVVSDLDGSDAAMRLRDAGMIVVDPTATEVLLTRFSRLDRVSLDVALSTLDELDPRRDEFIDGLGSYFRPEEAGSTLYVSAEHGAWRTRRLVARILGRGSRLADHFPWVHAVSVALFCIISAAVSVLSRQVLTPAVAVAWLPAVAAFALPGTVAATLFVIAWSWSIRDVRGVIAALRVGRPVSFPAALAAAWPVFAVLVSGLVLDLSHGPHSWPVVVIAAVGTAAISILTDGPTVASSLDHDLFRPVSLFTGSHEETTGPARLIRTPGTVGILVLALLIVPPVLDNVAYSTPSVVPRPLDTRTAISYDSLRQHQARRSSGLVDLSDYIAHRAYQETIAFGRSFGVPEQGETVGLSRFRETDSGSYSRFVEEVAVFDDEWLVNALENPSSGIASMLIAVGGVSGVVAGPERSLYSGYPQVLKHSMYVVLAFLPVVVSSLRLPGIRRHSKVVEIARRRKQVA